MAEWLTISFVMTRVPFRVFRTRISSDVVFYVALESNEVCGIRYHY
jgi:hypothetical protein